MYVTNIAGESEYLAGYTNLTRNSAVNGNRSLSFLLPKTPVNAHAFNLVEEESVITYDGHDYRIKSVEERVVGQTPVKSIVAPHVFFDLVDEFRYGTLANGAKSISQVLSFIFSGTDWTFTVIDPYDSVEFDNFGDDNCISLFNDVLERYGAEFDLNGREVIIRSQIGATIDLQFRYNHNVKTFKRKLDTSNLSTYIRGAGKLDEEGNPVVTAEYTSPNATVFGIRHAPFYSNETITYESTLLKHLKRKLQDTPKLTIELDFAVLKDAGYLSEKPGLGDVVPTVYEPLNIDLDLRVMEIEDYAESNKAPRITLATENQTYAKSVISYQKSLLDKIFDENTGRLRYNVYDDAVKRATEALNNSLTELEYPPGMGIIARDPNDSLRFVALRSAGLGVTVDGGQTFKEAITADGVTTSLLTAGQIKTNNIQIIGNDDLFYWDGSALMAISASDANKYVRLNSDGLYIAKGAMTVEREDGFKTVIDGYANLNYNLFSACPNFTSTAVTAEGAWFKTNSTDSANMNFYTFRHEGRYLKAHLAYHMESHEGSVSGGLYITDSSDGSSIFSKVFTNQGSGTEEARYGSVFTIDLGVPTGQGKGVYVRLKTGASSQFAYGRIIRMWQEG